MQRKYPPLCPVDMSYSCRRACFLLFLCGGGDCTRTSLNISEEKYLFLLQTSGVTFKMLFTQVKNERHHLPVQAHLSGSTCPSPCVITVPLPGWPSPWHLFADTAIWCHQHQGPVCSQAGGGGRGGGGGGEGISMALLIYSTPSLWLWLQATGANVKPPSGSSLRLLNSFYGSCRSLSQVSFPDWATLHLIQPDSISRITSRELNAAGQHGMHCEKPLDRILHTPGGVSLSEIINVKRPSENKLSAFSVWLA